MAHELKASTCEHTQAVRRNIDLYSPSIWQAKVDLAACFRMAARLGLAEGICNHFSAIVPGCNDLFLVNPIGLAFCEIRPDNLLICDFDGSVISGDGKPEATAFYIHAQIHKALPRVAAAFHTHMPYATALTMVDRFPLTWAGQTALKFFGRTAVYERYNGLALDEAEGKLIAESMLNADILFMRNHGVLVGGASIAEAWDDLYYLERAAEVQVKALSTGLALMPVQTDVAQATARQMREGDPESARLHLECIKRMLGD